MIYPPLVSGCVSPHDGTVLRTPSGCLRRPHLRRFPRPRTPLNPHRQKNYAEAQKIKRIADVMEERERKSIDTDNRKIFARKEVRVDKTHPSHRQMCTYIAHTVYSTALCIIHMCIDTTAYVIEARLCYLVRLLGHSVVAVCSTPHSDRPSQWRHAFVTVSTPATNHKPGSFSYISLPNMTTSPPPLYVLCSGMTMYCCRPNCASSSRRSSRHF